MNISRIFIQRPVMTSLVMSAFLIFGLIAYFSLPITELPAVDFPTIMVSASLPGANAETMASAVATPLEKQLSLIAGVDSMSSQSQLGSTTITLQFALNRDVDGAAEDVQGAIVAARATLPTNMPTPPTFRKVNPADAPILYIALSSATQPLYKVDEYAENILAPRISMISGVAQVVVFGSQIYSPHVQVDPRKLAAYGMGINQVATAISNANVNLPTGTLYGPDMAYNVMANGQLFNAAAFSPVIVAYKNGSPVRLSDLGRVIDSVQTDKVASWYNNTRAIVLAVQKQPNTNTIGIVDDIYNLFPNFKAILAGSIKMDVVYDRSTSVRRSVSEAKRTLLLTVVLIIGVISLTLGSLSSTIIASLTLPISLIGTFAAMKVFDFSINNISLMALTLCVGFVVDDTIVVLENIVRHIEAGETPMVAALKGAQEIGFTIVSMTLSLVAVFIPVLFMGGIVGRLFFQFGATLTIAILISGFVSLSLSPMLCSRFLRLRRLEDTGPTAHKKFNFFALSEHWFDRMRSVYEKILQFALHHRFWVLCGFVLMVISTGIILGIMPKGFIPSEDTGQIIGATQAQEGISFDDMVLHQKRVMSILSDDPNVKSVMSSVASGPRAATVNEGTVFLVLKPMGQRKLTADQVVSEIRKKVSKIPGMQVFMQVPPSIRVGGQITKALYQCSISGPDIDELYKASHKMEDSLKALPEITDLNSDLQIKNLQLTVNMDRQKLAQLGLTVEQVQDALNSAYSARQVSVIYTPDDQYWVILEVEPKYYRDPAMLSYLQLRTDSGALVPLSTVATMVPSAGPEQVNHVGQFPSVTFSFNLRNNTSLSQAVDKIRATAQNLPPNITFSFEGTAKSFESSAQDMGALLVVAILVIYIVLGILYESFIHPITILSGLPSAGLGALITLLLFGKDLDLYGFLGLILLIGIVKKNAIMVVDFALDEMRLRGASPEEAIYKACLTRFRPIMMTTFAAILGSVPIALGGGQGHETRQPLGLAVVGGLLVSQLVTLLITPVFFLYLEQFKSWLERRQNRRTVFEG